MPAFSDPAQRSGAAKSKEEAEGEQACAAPRDGAGSPAGNAQATDHMDSIPYHTPEGNRAPAGPWTVIRPVR